MEQGPYIKKVVPEVWKRAIDSDGEDELVNDDPIYIIYDEHGREIGCEYEYDQARQYLDQYRSLKNFKKEIQSIPLEDPIYQDLTPAFAKVKDGMFTSKFHKRGETFQLDGTPYTDDTRWVNVPGYRNTDPYTGDTYLDNEKNSCLEIGLLMLEEILHEKGLVRGTYETYSDRKTRVTKGINFDDFDVNPFESREVEWNGLRDYVPIKRSVDRFPHVDEMLQEIRDIVTWNNRSPTREEVYEIVERYLPTFNIEN